MFVRLIDLEVIQRTHRHTLSNLSLLSTVLFKIFFKTIIRETNSPSLQLLVARMQPKCSDRRVNDALNPATGNNKSMWPPGDADL